MLLAWVHALLILEEQRCRQCRFVPVRMAQGRFSASSDAVGADVVAHGDPREPKQARCGPHRHTLQLGLLDRLPTGELACSRRSQRAAAIDGSVGRRSVGCPIGGCAGQGAPGTSTGDNPLVIGMAGESGAGGAQPTRRRRGQAHRERLAVMADREVAVRSLDHVHPRAPQSWSAPGRAKATVCASGA